MEKIIFDKKEQKFRYESSNFWRGGWTTNFTLKTTGIHIYGNYEELTTEEKTIVKPEVKKIVSTYNFNHPVKIHC